MLLGMLLGILPLLVPLVSSLACSLTQRALHGALVVLRCDPSPAMALDDRADGLVGGAQPDSELADATLCNGALVSAEFSALDTLHSLRVLARDRAPHRSARAA